MLVLLSIRFFGCLLRCRLVFQIVSKSLFSFEILRMNNNYVATTLETCLMEIGNIFGNLGDQNM